MRRIIGTGGKKICTNFWKPPKCRENRNSGCCLLLTGYWVHFPYEESYRWRVYSYIATQFISFLTSDEWYCTLRQKGVMGDGTYGLENNEYAAWSFQCPTNQCWSVALQFPQPHFSQFFPLEYLKHRIYYNHPQILAALRANTMQKISVITPAMLRHVSQNMVQRARACLQTDMLWFWVYERIQPWQFS